MRLCCCLFGFDLRNSVNTEINNTNNAVTNLTNSTDDIQF